jgi:hypothetical protein
MTEKKINNREVNEAIIDKSAWRRVRRQRLNRREDEESSEEE